MKNYKEFECDYIGSSDYATLILVGGTNIGVCAETLHFGGDGSYSAYIVRGVAEIGGHYKKVASFKNWLKIYDDTEFVREFEGNEINIFQAGEYGCIIQIIENSEVQDYE